jgi:hypothetical protein
MLFDLQGKRKRFVQVIYAGLAILIGGGLVFFGIGGAGNGGLLDAVGIGGGNTSSSSNYDDQIDKANETLQGNPKDERALLALARYQFLKGQEQRDVADARPALGTYQDLATYAYYAQNEQVAKAAAKKAIAEAPDSTTRKQVEQALKQAQAQAKLAAKQQKQQAQAAGQQGTGALPDPTAALGGSSGTAPAP